MPCPLIPRLISVAARSEIKPGGTGLVEQLLSCLHDRRRELTANTEE
jgi:hypothetical protein